MLVERTGKEGWSVASADGVTVALDARLDDELEREGRVYDLIHRVNSMRKEAGLEYIGNYQDTAYWHYELDEPDHFHAAQGYEYYARGAL